MKYAGGALLPTLRVNRESGRPIGVQLVSAIRELVLSGVLAPGQRLPSSRTFAHDQGISRTTAISVYESLTAEGLIVSRVGSGSYVSDVLKVKAEAASTEHAGKVKQPTRLASLASRASEQFFPRLSHPTNPRPFVTGLPALDMFPAIEGARTTRQLRLQASQLRPITCLLQGVRRLAWPSAGGTPARRT